MRTLIALLTLLALPLNASLPEDLDRYLTARTNLSQFSGAVLVIHEGKVLLRKGYGYANLEHLVANKPETKFEIASLTKAFTAFAAYELSREGKLNLDASVCTYVVRCPPAWQPVTVASLIHHRSGIPDYEESLEMGSPEYVASLTQPQTVPAMLDWARARPLAFVPGTEFAYSNTAYLLLGTILETVSGQRYEDLLRERVFVPFGMTSTSHIDRKRVERDRAEGYTHEAPLEEGLRGIALTSTYLRHVPLLSQDPPQADGGLLSTINDLEKWARAFLGEGAIPRATLDALLRPDGAYAFGWNVGERFERKRIWHTGVLPGMVSGFDLYPETRTVILWLGNLDRIRMSNVTRDLTAIVFGLPYDVPRSHPVRTIDAAHAAPLLGDYELEDGRVMTITHNSEKGWLTAAIKNQFTAGVLPESDILFYAPMWEGTLTFASNGSSLVMRQSGQDLRGKRR